MSASASFHLDGRRQSSAVVAGGGTLTAAVAGNETYAISSRTKTDPRFADIWQTAHRVAALIQADIGAVETFDLPEFDICIGGIPCTSHTTLGRAKKSLGEIPKSATPATCSFS